MPRQGLLSSLIGGLCFIALITGCQSSSPLVTGPLPRLNPPGGFRLLSQPADVHSLRFCLLEHDTGVPLAGSQNLVPIGPVFSATLTPGPTPTLNFGNVRANGSGKSYSLAVAAFDQAGNNLTDSTGDNALHQRVTISGETGNFYLSVRGGDAEHVGSVRVSPSSYTLSGLETLGVDLRLADG